MTPISSKRHCCWPFRSNPLTYICALSLLSGCAEYRVSVNDQPIDINPPQLPVAEVADIALSNCIQQTIDDRKIESVAMLTLLICTNAGIQSISGLEAYGALERLSLNGNELTAVATLSQLPALRYVDLRENPRLNCEHIGLIRKALRKNLKGELEIELPDHCRH